MVYKDAVKFCEKIPKQSNPLVRAGMKEFPPHKISDLSKFPGGSSISFLGARDMHCRVSNLDDPRVRLTFNMDSLSDYGKFDDRHGFLKALGEGLVCISSDILNPIGKTSLQHFEEDGNVTILGLTECEDLRKSYVLKYI